MAPLGRSQERSGIDVIGFWLTADVNLLGGVERHVYAIVSGLIYGFAFCCLTQCGLAAHRRIGSAKMQRQTVVDEFGLFPLNILCASG